MTTSNVQGLEGRKVVIPFDIYGAPTKDAVGIYAQILGQLACEPINLPITYADWRTMPKAWKDEIFDKEIKVLKSQCVFSLFGIMLVICTN